MANRWCDGFGRYGTDEAKMLNGSSGQAWAEVGTPVFSLETANPRTGSYHLRMRSGDTGSAIARRVFGAPLTEVWLGRAVYCHALPSEEHIFSGGGLPDDSNKGTCLFSLRDQSNNGQIGIWLGTDGAIEARRYQTFLGRSLPVIGAGAYQYIELYAKASNTVGAIEIRVDEVTVLNLTGIDTVNSANVEFSQDGFGHGALNAGSPIIDFADFYCNDNVADGSACDNFLGDVKSGCLMVNADTAQADFTLSSGVSGYALLDEVGPNDGDYIDTAASTAESDFELQGGPANLSEILTVRPFVRAMKDDAGTCTIAPNVKSSGVKGTVSDQPVTTAFAYYDSNIPVDPNTSVPFTPSGLNALQHVVERTA